MRSEIDAAIDLLQAAKAKLRQIKQMADSYPKPDSVHAQVDVGHAEYQVERAIGFVNRLVVNGRKPWDE
jgi:hypothetical protein